MTFVNFEFKGEFCQIESFGNTEQMVTAHFIFLGISSKLQTSNPFEVRSV